MTFFKVLRLLVLFHYPLTSRSCLHLSSLIFGLDSLCPVFGLLLATLASMTLKFEVWSWASMTITFESMSASLVYKFATKSCSLAIFSSFSTIQTFSFRIALMEAHNSSSSLAFQALPPSRVPSRHRLVPWQSSSHP